MSTYIATTSSPETQEQYGTNAGEANWTAAIPAPSPAAGPLIWSPLPDIYGRRIISIIGTATAFAATVGTAKAPNCGGYMAARIFQGLGVSPEPQSAYH